VSPPRIAITMGDAAGVGPEVIMKALAHAEVYALCRPLVVGDASAEAVAQVLELLWGGEKTLIVISSDLSHYLPYEQAQAVDHATAQRILSLDSGLTPHEACGAAAINGALLAARRHGLAPRLLDLRNSGDTAGDRDRVVGYGAIAFEEQQ